MTQAYMEEEKELLHILRVIGQPIFILSVSNH